LLGRIFRTAADLQVKSATISEFLVRKLGEVILISVYGKLVSAKLDIERCVEKVGKLLDKGGLEKKILLERFASLRRLEPRCGT
jgi:hypothetical protein